MDKSLTLTPTDALALVPADAGKDARHRLQRFERWLADAGLPWARPDLAAYRDHLLATLKPSSVLVHLSTIRGRYRALLKQNVVRDALYAKVPPDLSIMRKVLSEASDLTCHLSSLSAPLSANNCRVASAPAPPCILVMASVAAAVSTMSRMLAGIMPMPTLPES